jgi:hypothetical protein
MKQQCGGRCSGGIRAGDGPHRGYIMLRIVAISCLVAILGHHSSTNSEPRLAALAVLVAVICTGFGFVWARTCHRARRSRREAWRGSLARQLGLVCMAQLMEWTWWCFIHTQCKGAGRPRALGLALHLCWAVQHHHCGKRLLKHGFMNVLLVCCCLWLPSVEWAPLWASYTGGGFAPPSSCCAGTWPRIKPDALSGACKCATYFHQGGACQVHRLQVPNRGNYDVLDPGWQCANNAIGGPKCGCYR